MNRRHRPDHPRRPAGLLQWQPQSTDRLEEDSVEPQPKLAFSYIRWSSPEQAAGDSYRRQIEAAKRWAENNGYILTDPDRFVDDGVSAFRGRNDHEGRLREFRDAVREGSIPKGSALIVENLDRLSRDDWEPAMGTLMGIIKDGVDVVTLTDGKIYRQGEVDGMTAMYILMGFIRAHDESKQKSKRNSAAWHANNEKVKEGKRKRTRVIPHWLRMVKASDPSQPAAGLDDVAFEVIPDLADQVRWVFEGFADGKSIQGMAKTLREQGVVAIKSKRPMLASHLSLLLKSVAPYGDLVIYPRDPERQEVIKDYYPRIVDAETERRVRFRQALNLRGKAKPPSGKEQINYGLLSGVLLGEDDRAVRIKDYSDSRIGNTRYHTQSNKYLGTVKAIDQILIDHWCEVLDAFEVDYSPEIEGYEAMLADLYVAIEKLDQRPPSPQVERMRLARQAEIEEIKAEIARVNTSRWARMDLPPDLYGLNKAVGNAAVKKVVEWAKLTKNGKGTAARMMLSLMLKNGILMQIGDPSARFEARGS